MEMRYRINVDWLGKEYVGRIVFLEEFKALCLAHGVIYKLEPERPNAPAYYNPGSGVEVLTAISDTSTREEGCPE